MSALPALREHACDKTRFISIEHYTDYAQRYLEFIGAPQATQAVIVSQNEPTTNSSNTRTTEVSTSLVRSTHASSIPPLTSPASSLASAPCWPLDATHVPHPPTARS